MNKKTAAGLTGLMLVLALTASAPAAATINRTATAGHRSEPAARGQLRSDHRMLVVARGFTAGRRVLIRRWHQADWQRIQVADRRGVVSVAVALGPGPDVLTFVEQDPSRPAPGSGNVAVTVPRIAVYHLPPAGSGRR